MFSYSLPAPGEHPLYDAGRKIAFHTYQRFGVTPDEEFEDAIQQAAMTYWYHSEVRGKGPGYAWIAARRDLAHHRFTRNYNPRYPKSLDLPQYRDYDRPWLQDLATAEHDSAGYTDQLTTDDNRRPTDLDPASIKCGRLDDAVLVVSGRFVKCRVVKLDDLPVFEDRVRNPDFLTEAHRDAFG